MDFNTHADRPHCHPTIFSLSSGVSFDHLGRKVRLLPPLGAVVGPSGLSIRATALTGGGGCMGPSGPSIPTNAPLFVLVDPPSSRLFP